MTARSKLLMPKRDTECLDFSFVNQVARQSSSRALSQLLDSVDCHSAHSVAAIIRPTVARCAAYKSKVGFGVGFGQDCFVFEPRVKHFGAGKAPADSGLHTRSSSFMSTLHDLVFREDDGWK